MSKKRNAVLSLEEGDPIEFISFHKEYMEHDENIELEVSEEKDKVENFPFLMGGPPPPPPPFTLYKKDNLHRCRAGVLDTDTLRSYFVENGKPNDIFSFEISNSMNYNYQSQFDLWMNEGIYRFIDFIKYLKDTLKIYTVCNLNAPITGELAYTAFVVDKIELGEMGFLAFGYNRMDMKDSKWLSQEIFVKKLLQIGVNKEFITETDKDQLLTKKSHIILTYDKLKFILDEQNKKLEQSEKDKMGIVQNV